MGGRKLAQRVAGQQRGISHRDEDGAGEVVGERREPALDGAAGAGDLVLVGDDGHRILDADVLGHEVALMAYDDDEMGGLGRAGRDERMTEQGSSGQGMQHFRGRGLHPRAAPRRQHDDRCGTVCCHVCSSSGVSVCSPAWLRSRTSSFKGLRAAGLPHRGMRGVRP